MKNFKYIITLGTFLSFSILGITSCVDGNDWDTVTANRLFGPKDKNFSITPDENIAQFEVTWKGVKDAKSYILEISTSPLSDDTEMGTAEGSLVFGNGNDKITSSPYIIKELLPETSYYARIKAIGQGIESNWVYAEKTYKTVKEQLLYEPSEENGDITKNSIHISWMEGCKVTALRIYTTDKLYDETIQLDATAQEAAAYTFTDLTSLTDYTIELLNGEIKRGTIKVTTAMGDMIEVAVSEITSNSAKFTWDEAADSYTLIEGEAPTKDGAIQFDSSATTTFAASNLKDNTTYTFSVIRKGAVIGYCTFTTIKGLPANFTLISSGSELETALSTGSGEVALKINDGSVIELDKTITISKNITSLICFSDNMNTPPTIKTSGISVETGALLANMEFYNLKLTNEDSSNGYVVNIDQKCTIQKLTFEKCTISKLRGVFRAQKLESNGGLAATIGNITFNNSIIQNIGNYGVVNTYEDLSKKPEDAKYYTLTLGAIKFEKSTINTIGAQLIRILQEPNVVINQCTFYGLANKAVIDNNKEKKGTITISNTIVGKTDATKGYEGPTLTSNDTYTTSDCKFGSKNTWGTSIPISSTDLFVNAAEGDFTIQSSEYKAYGDPRWNK
mgnify:FL=1|jgi:hypothetical protein